MKLRQTEDDLTATPDLPLGRTPTSYRRGWVLAMTATALVVVLATLPPFVNPVWRLAIMQGFSFACHQLPARSPSIDGVQLAVCHRCYGIYWGLFLAATAFVILRRWDTFFDRNARFLLPLSIAVPGVDWLLGITDVWNNTPASRLATGSVFGLVAGFYLARALAHAFLRDGEAVPDERKETGDDLPRATIAEPS